MKKVISIVVSLVVVFISLGVAPAVSAAAPKTITLSKTSKTVYIGQKYKLKVKAVTPKKADASVEWKTSDKKIATVNKNGVVTGKKKGTVTITAISTENKKIKAKCKITVKKFKKVSIDYKSNILSYSDNITLLYHNLEGAKQEDPYIIKTYDELKALKKHIKKTYDIKNVYDEESIWFEDEKFAEHCNGDEILEALGKYDKKFFKTKALYYNCIDFTTAVDNVNVDYSFKCTKVKKSISPGGKLTCYMHIKRNIDKVSKTELETTTDFDTSVYFIALDKEDIKGVQSFKLKHYEYFDLEYNDEVFEPD